MNAAELLQRLKSAPAGSPLDWKAVREEIAEEYERAPAADRVTLLQIYQAVMDRAERAVSSADLPTFRTARRQDYNRMLLSECIVNGGNLSPNAIKVVTDREVAAGRMAPDDELRRLAVAGTPVLAMTEPPRTGWRRTIGWKRKSK